MEPQGSSMTVSVKKVEASVAEKEESVFNLDGALEHLDTASGSRDISRALCAYVCGLASKEILREKLTAAPKKKGVSKDDLKVVLDSVDSAKLWKAYCFYSFYVGVTPQEAAAKFSLPVAHLQAVLKYKPMAYVFTYVKWPEEFV